MHIGTDLSNLSEVLFAVLAYFVVCEKAFTKSDGDGRIVPRLVRSRRVNAQYSKPGTHHAN